MPRQISIAYTNNNVCSIQLKNGFSANSTYFTIPTFEQGNTDDSLHYQILNEIKINQLSNNLWEGEKGIMQNLRVFRDKINDYQTPMTLGIISCLFNDNSRCNCADL